MTGIADGEWGLADLLPASLQACQVANMQESLSHLAVHAGLISLAWACVHVAQSLKLLYGAKDGIGVLFLIAATQLALDNAKVLGVVLKACSTVRGRDNLVLILGKYDGRVVLNGNRLENHTCLGCGLANNYGHILLDNTCFLHSNLLERIAQELRVVHADIGDNG